MKRALFSILSFVVLSFVILPSLSAEDLNDLAYRYRFLLKAGTILNSDGIGDCLLFPYYDVRTEAGSSQVSEISIQNTSEYGIAAKLRVRDWSQGREVFSADIWIPSAGFWSGKIELAENGTNAKITSFDSVITNYDTGSFYLSQSLNSTPLFSIPKKKGEGPSPSGLYGYVEVIGEEKTAPSEINSVVSRLAASEQDCPNSLKGTATIQRTEEGVSMDYEAVAIGNFSRGQGSLFRSPGSPYPLLSNGEDSLDQIEFQLSKWEMMGPYSLNQSIQEKTHLIITFPTKHFHYKDFSKRINNIDNPFKASNMKTGENLTTTVIGENPGQETDSTINLPFAVNVIGLSDYYSGTPTGIDNSGMSSPYESGEVKLTSDNFAQRTMIQDFEYLQQRFSTYRGLPSLGLILHEYRNPNLQATITPVEFSAVWKASDLESVFIPSPPSGPSFGSSGVSYTYSVSGSASSLGHPIQYLIDWGDGTNTGWLAVGTASASKTWTIGGAYAIRAKARCSIHTDIVSTWSDGLTVTIESVSSPTSLSGPTEGIPNQSYTYTANGSASSAGHSLEYQFDWKGDGTDLSPWGSGTQSKTWATGGVYTIRARARCATHNSIISAWTSGLTVTIELISKPSKPVGPTTGDPGMAYSFSTNAVSNLGHPLEFQFDWGDGSFSSWGSSTQSKSWSGYGTFKVKVKARCQIHPAVESGWSDELEFNIETVSIPSPPTGPTFAMKGVSNTYTTGGAVSSSGHVLEYQFDWGDGIPSPWGGASQSKVWSNSGSYIVKVMARCQLHPTIVSGWSSWLMVVIESVSTPATPIGQMNGAVGEGYGYSTGGSSSDLGHQVQYHFDWGNGTTSEWLPIGITNVGKAWPEPGTYIVKAQARCAIHGTIISNWSQGILVTINPGPPPQTETISIPFIETVGDRGSIYEVSSNLITGVKNIPYNFTNSAGISNLGHAVEYQYDWGERDPQGNPILSQWGETPVKAWPTSSLRDRPFCPSGGIVGETCPYVIKVRARCVQHPTVVSEWSSGLQMVIDYISPPNVPSGPTSGTTGISYTYSTGGSQSDISQPIQYRFNWGDGTNSGWLPVGVVSAPKIWMVQGTYTVRVDARGWDYLGADGSTEHTSFYSPELSVKITMPVEESITAPNAPSGPSTGLPNTVYTYSTGGSVSSLGHSVQYFFDWGDGTDSNWLPVGTTSATKSWPAGGTYTVRVKARCATDTSAVSPWSVVLTVRIELISAPNTPIGPVTGLPGDTFTYMTGGATSNIGHGVEYQFDWTGDGSDLSAWGSTSRSKTWAAGGNYLVRARARCVTDTSIVSGWSSALNVKIELITVSTPTGPTSPAVNSSGTYSAMGSSNIGDPVQIRFVFSDGVDSGFLPVGTTTFYKTWTSSGSFTVVAQARCAIHTSNVSALSDPLAVTVNKLSQTITFGPLPNKNYGDPPFDVNATASSGLPVSFSIVSGPATIAGNTVTLTGTGTVTVKASQAGNGTYSAAPDVTQSFAVNNPVPTTTSISPNTVKAGDPGFTLTVHGTNFVPTSVVRFNGSDRNTAFVDATQLTATILKSDIAVAGPFPIAVFNPAPGGGLSNAQPLTVGP